jgi:hypothetical protein
MRTCRLVLVLLGLLPSWFASPAGGQVPAKEPASAAARTPDLVPVIWLEPADAKAGTEGRGGPQTLRLIPSSDTRARDAERLIDNEPARFTRRLVGWAWRTFGSSPDWPEPRLPIVLRPGGNNAGQGFRLVSAGGAVEEHPAVPFLVLELDSKSLSDTLIHEGGHLLHSIATRGHRAAADWSAILHTTFAVTDPLTAVSEGYAIHFETLLGHYGLGEETRGFYHRVAPAFDLKQGRRSEYYAPIADLMTFSQSWARYQAVRDTWPAFAGHVYPGDYLRSQFDPARDRAVLKPAGAMLASEGVAASVLFWTSVGLAGRDGAAFGHGLDQPGLLRAEQVLLTALSRLPAPSGFRPDLIDVVSAVGEAGSAERAVAVSRFVNVTRGVTARPDIRGTWAAVYRDAVALDFDATKPRFSELDTARDAILDAALAEPGTLRRGLGPILPVSAAKVVLELKVLRQKFPLEFDLNAATEAEWAAVGVDARTSARCLSERDRLPFSSMADFEARTGVTLQALGLTTVRVSEDRR